MRLSQIVFTLALLVSLCSWIHQDRAHAEPLCPDVERCCIDLYESIRASGRMTVPPRTPGMCDSTYTDVALGMEYPCLTLMNVHQMFAQNLVVEGIIPAVPYYCSQEFQDVPIDPDDDFVLVPGGPETDDESWTMESGEEEWTIEAEEPDDFIIESGEGTDDFTIESDPGEDFTIESDPGDDFIIESDPPWPGGDDWEIVPGSPGS